MNMLATNITPEPLTVEEVRSRLQTAECRIGEGRLSLTLVTFGSDAAYLTHWFRPTPYAFEDCKSVGAGSVTECMAALERYVADYRRHSLSAAELGATPGIETPVPAIAAE